MLARVAQAQRRSIFDVAAGPLHEALFDYLQLSELERLDGLQREADALTAAARMNHAFCDPARLGRQLEAFRARLWERPHVERGSVLTDDERARAEAIIAGLNAPAPLLPS